MAEVDGFSGTPWAAGSMVGLRNFRLMPGGVLTGMTGTQWHTGVNEATCLPQIRRGRASEGHPVASKDCSCGFWAYLRPELAGTEQYGSSLVGIVEGFGYVTYGPLGFRCSKARILALVAPAPEISADERRSWVADRGLPEPDEATMARVEDHPPAPVPAASNLLWNSIVWGIPIVLSVALVMALSFTPVAPSGGFAWWQIALGVLGALFVIRFLGAFFGTLWWQFETDRRAQEETASMILQGTDAVHQRYPEIRFYDSLEQALEDFPLTR